MLKKLFGFDPTKTSVKTEIIAGVTTFLTMSYILAVNPSMFGQLDGMPGGAVFTSTALAAIIGCLAMAFWGKLPFGLAPGMGLNAFFVYSVCMGMGYSWQFALTAVLIEGIIFIILTLTNVREAIVNAIPLSLRNAIGAGIGLFIAFIGLESAGVIVPDDATHRYHHYRLPICAQCAWRYPHRYPRDNDHRYPYGCHRVPGRAFEPGIDQAYLLPVRVREHFLS